MKNLRQNEVHLWWAFPDEIADQTILARQLMGLSSKEKTQQLSFVFERHRHQYLVSHALVRDVLSQYVPVKPEDWCFETNAYGRPYIEEPAEYRKLQFNLSHTSGRALVGVAWDIDLGVDVEAISLRTDFSDMADRFFSSLEIAQLRQEPSLFFDFWTLKEAYIKARGMGLSIPLNSFSIVLSKVQQPRIVFHGQCSDHPDSWQFVLRAMPGFRMALAAAVPNRDRLIVVENKIVPMAEPPGYLS